MTSYRRNVAAVILNEQGKVLACRRADEFKAWQLPQGGIDPGETPVQALFRELQEEIGTAEVEILDELPLPIRYDWPVDLHSRGHVGQEQHYFLVRFLPGAKAELEKSSSKEFEGVEWMEIEDFVGLIQGFKRDAYVGALTQFRKRHPELFR